MGTHVLQVTAPKADIIRHRHRLQNRTTYSHDSLLKGHGMRPRYRRIGPIQEKLTTNKADPAIYESACAARPRTFKESHAKRKRPGVLIPGFAQAPKAVPLQKSD